MFWVQDQNLKNWLPYLQAHRGYWVEGLPQNTLQSIQKAFSLGYQMVEFDVRLTQDQVVVLFHDEFLGPKKISDYRATELPQVSRLEDLFKWFQSDKIKNFKLNIEIKSKKIFDGRLEKQVMHLIERYQMRSAVMISSFNPFSLFQFYRMDRSLYRALLLTNGPESNWLLNNFIFNFLARPHLLNIRVEDFHKKKYQKLSSQIPIVLWTVNDLNMGQKFKDQISGLITDQIRP